MFKSLFDAGYKELKKDEKLANKIDALADEYKELSDEELQGKTEIFRERLNKGETLDDILIEAFATVREASTRVLGLTPFKVQLVGAIALHGGNVAEMKTGEGKTLTSTLVAYLNALAGKGVHIVTVNEYLAERDATEMGELFKWLGLTVGLNLRALTKEEKQQQYNCDIMYSISSELGFDYLRDHMVMNKDNLVQRPLNFAIIDEADSILVDEARTPLIISGPTENKQMLYDKVDGFVKRLHGRKINATLDAEEEKLDFDDDTSEYIVDVRSHHVIITDKGSRKAEKNFDIPENSLYDVENVNLLHLIHNSLRANYLMKRDVDYAVQDNKVIIIDKSTGRLMHGRQYSDGLHQALEAKENVKINKETRIVATITIQNFFRMYHKLAGMTGTAKTEEEEFRDIYNMYVVEIPTNLPMIRQDAPDFLFLTKQAKFDALIEDIYDRHTKGQPVLVGTASDEMSIMVMRALRTKYKNVSRNIEVLNAKNHAREAKIIAKAGEIGAITIATNMAGRGTDIKLAEGVEQLGGLAVLGTERNESRRIDNQLRGRSGRQGNPGYSRFYISLEDELLVRFGAERLRGALSMLVKEKGSDKEVPVEYKMFSRFVENAQKKIESLNYDSRKHVLEYDEVLRRQREVIYSQREKILFVDDLSEIVANIVESATYHFVDSALGERKYYDDEVIDDFLKEVNNNFLPAGMIKNEELYGKKYDEIVQKLLEQTKKIFEIKKTNLPTEIFNDYLRYLLLRSIDIKWLDHIDQMDELRQTVRLQSYAQMNPLREYQEIGFQAFNEMLAEIELSITKLINRGKIQINIRREEQQNLQASYASSGDGGATQKRQPAKATKEPGRNDPCPCGSGKKYKNCCMNK